LGAEVEEYWKTASVNPWTVKENLTPAAERLLEFGRPRAALHCLYRLAAARIPIPPSMGIRTLLEAVRDGEESAVLDRSSTLVVIKALQDDPKTDAAALFQVEWAYLPILDHEFGGIPRTLEQRLADSPTFFVDLIGRIFHSEGDEKKEEPTDAAKSIAQNAYRLLRAWRTVPGRKPDGTFDPAAFTSWVAEVKRLVTESGHFKISMSQLGQVLPYAPIDPNELWIHRSVAEELNAKDAAEMRSGFTMEIFNQRGVHGYTAGKDEQSIAHGLHQKAEAVENAGFHRFATAIRELAKQYERDAERDSKRGPFDD
jgi:hypothetical protein